MGYSVSSSFLALKDQYAPQYPQRAFYVGSTAYTDYVTRWPSLSVRWDDPSPQIAEITLANETGAFGTFKDTPTTMRQNCSVQVGFNGELIEVFNGKVKAASFADGKCMLRLADKLTDLADRVIGTSDVPVSYLSSNYLLSDIVRWAVVSYGGFSSVQSTSNPDIDWADFLAWASVFSSSSIYVNARFDGLKVLEVLQKAAQISQSAIFLKQNKLSFKRFTLADSNNTVFSPANMTRPAELSISDDDIINRFHTFANYSTTSDYFLIDTVDTSSASVNSFGLREAIQQDSVLWYTNSTSALDLSQRQTLIYKYPVKRATIYTALPGITRLVGEMFSATDEGAELIGDTFRLMNFNYDMNESSIRMVGDASQVFGGFTLDTSSLDGADVLL